MDSILEQKIRDADISEMQKSFSMLEFKTLSERIKKIFSNLIPDWYLSPYFVIAFWYNFERFYLNPRGGEVEEVWEEPMELVLILGITLFLSVKFVMMYLKKIQKFC